MNRYRIYGIGTVTEVPGMPVTHSERYRIRVESVKTVAVINWREQAILGAGDCT